jgi:hypothetical protein
MATSNDARVIGSARRSTNLTAPVPARTLRFRIEFRLRGAITSLQMPQRLAHQCLRCRRDERCARERHRGPRLRRSEAHLRPCELGIARVGRRPTVGAAVFAKTSRGALPVIASLPS